MSRSRKKHPYISDNNAGMQLARHRAVRSKYKQISKRYVKQWIDPNRLYEWPEEDHMFQDDPEYPDPRIIVNDYDIWDWKFIDHLKGYRK